MAIDFFCNFAWNFAHIYQIVIISKRLKNKGIYIFYVKMANRKRQCMNSQCFTYLMLDECWIKINKGYLLWKPLLRCFSISSNSVDIVCNIFFFLIAFVLSTENHEYNRRTKIYAKYNSSSFKHEEKTIIVILNAEKRVPKIFLIFFLINHSPF